MYYKDCAQSWWFWSQNKELSDMSSTYINFEIKRVFLAQFLWVRKGLAVNTGPQSTSQNETLVRCRQIVMQMASL